MVNLHLDSTIWQQVRRGAIYRAPTIYNLSIRCWCGVDRSSLFQDRTQLLGIERLVQAQRACDAIKRYVVLRKQFYCVIISPFHDTIDFLVDDAGCFFAVFTRICRQWGAQKWVIALAIRNRSEAFAHAPTRNHLACDRGDTLK